MKYLCLVCDENVMVQMVKAEAAAQFKEYEEFTDAIPPAGIIWVAIV